MAFKFKGRNFQAWAEFEIEAHGLTVLIGPSNEGKSSIARALKGLARNQLGAHYIRVGSDGIDLTLELEGRTVQVTRGPKGSTVYRFDGGDPYQKLNRGIPDPMLALGLNEIEIGDVHLDPCFAKQGAPQFLLEEQPGPLNAVLGAFASTERLEQGKREANLRIGKKQQEAKTLAEELREALALEQRLASLAEKANEVQNEINSLTPAIVEDEKVIDLIGRLIERRRHSDQLTTVLERLTVPSVTEILLEQDVVDSLARLVKANKRLILIDRTVAGLLNVPAMEPLAENARALDMVARLHYARRVEQAQNRWLDKVDEAVQEWTDVVNQHKESKVINELIGLKRKRETTSAAFLLGNIHRLTDEITHTAMNAQSEHHVVNALKSLIVARERFQSIQRDLGSSEQQLDTMRLRTNELEALLIEQAQTTTCPQCGEVFVPQTKPHNHSSNHKKEPTHA